jgi:hypothetical protein
MVSCGVESGSSKFASTWLDVDASFLGPQMPSLESKQAVSSLQGEDVLLLVSGEKIALAGLECNAKMFCYTQALFLGSEPDFFVCLPSGYVASIRLCLGCDVVGVGRPGFRVLAGD